MKTITFPVETRELTRPQINYMSNMSGNGLFNILYKGYSSHIPISLRPDDILNNVASVWAKYIVNHAEQFRDVFVDHEGKKELRLFSGGYYSDDRLPEFFDGMIKMITADQVDDQASWSTKHDFSTTGVEDRMVRASSALASQKEYYEFGWTLACGFPEIRLEGTEEDWADLLSAINSMPSLDGKLHEWRNHLLDLIDDMVEGSEEFWQSCVVDHPYGSGSQSKKDGWIVAFNPINENGEWVDIIEDQGVLDLKNDFMVNVDDNGNIFDLQVECGPTEVVLNENVLSVGNLIKLTKQEVAAT